MTEPPQRRLRGECGEELALAFPSQKVFIFTSSIDKPALTPETVCVLARWLTMSFLLILLRPCAQTASATRDRSMLAVFVEDQRDRGVPLSDNGIDMLPPQDREKLHHYTEQEIARRDEERRRLTLNLLEQGKLQTGHGFRYAAFIFQHGQVADDYLLAHVLAMDALAQGDLSAKTISAATLDRYLQTIGQKQIFGTQFSDERWAFYLQHRNDKKLASDLKAVSDRQTQQPYNDKLLPQSLRHDFCVAEIAEQKSYLQAANSGHAAALPRANHCSP